MIESLFLAAVVSMTSQQSMPTVHTDAVTSAFQRCVAHRESRGKPGAVSRTGNHRGKYQVTDAMRIGMSWNVLPWLKTWNHNASRYAAVLRHTPMNKWPEMVQDAAFVYTLHYAGDRWSGWQHWYLPGSRCNKLVP